MSVFDDVKTDLRELLGLVVEIDRIDHAMWQGRQFESEKAESVFRRKQRRASELRKKYGL